MDEQESPSSEQPKWGDPLDLVSDERKAELAQRLWGWNPKTATEEQPGPFAGESLNGLEVFWLAICSQAGENGDTTATEQSIRQTIADYETSGDPPGRGLKFPRLYLQGVHLDGAQLQRVCLGDAQLTNANLRDAQLQGASFISAKMAGADFNNAQLQGAELSFAKLQGADLSNTQLQGTYLDSAQLQAASLAGAQLTNADLSGAQLEGALLANATCAHANLRQVSLDKKSILYEAILTDVQLDQATFDGTNLSVVDWSLVPRLQDERVADQARYPKDFWAKELRGQRRVGAGRVAEYQAAARAYRRLVAALQANGMSEEAAGYAYRAQVMQRRVYWFSGWRSWGRWFFSGFLDLLAGYGYKPERSLAAYLLTLLVFAAFYYLLGPSQSHTFQWDGALIFSLTSFHGRGFFPESLTLENWIIRLAAFEAVTGLLIEISFIATFTQRFFGSK